MTRYDTIYRDAPALAPTVLAVRNEGRGRPSEPVRAARSGADDARDQRDVPSTAVAAS